MIAEGIEARPIVRAWLTSIIRRVCTEVRRTEVAAKRIRDAMAEAVRPPPDPMTRLTAREELRQVPRGLRAVYLVTLDAFLRHGCNYASAAAELRIPIPACRRGSRIFVGTSAAAATSTSSLSAPSQPTPMHPAHAPREHPLAFRPAESLGYRRPMPIDHGAIVKELDEIASLLIELRTRAQYDDCSDTPVEDRVRVLNLMVSAITRFAPPGSSHSANLAILTKDGTTANVSYKLAPALGLLRSLRDDYHAGRLRSLMKPSGCGRLWRLA